MNGRKGGERVTLIGMRVLALAARRGARQRTQLVMRSASRAVTSRGGWN